MALADPAARHADVVPDFYNTRIGSSRKMRNHIRQHGAGIPAEDRGKGS